ncbi:hypothetical protein EW146_g2566 [Bondarzewia mesenterica]|uniref:Uncharacterized protein n=1 Tax=Bondarzewia mesenterica TaxID=1095465 RepID=A0A4S4M0I2_9AGAM|nr:hypothetical protein EW146_g2566 [Bondarzewia mesenterica]
MPPQPAQAVYPIPWFRETFTSRARAEELLRPELENGTITQHDFDAAATFYPSHKSRYMPVLFGMLGATSVLAYGQFFRRPPMSITRMSSSGAIASVIGVLYGQVRIAEAHRDFVGSLDNRSGFFRALENVNIRTGGQRPLGLPIAHSTIGMKRSMTVAKRLPPPPPPPASLLYTDAVSPAEGIFLAAPKPAQSPVDPSRTGRWGEIRAVNARNGPRSTWDELRQNQERSRLPVAPQSADDAGSRSPTSDMDDRAAEQAKFDALLEAERRKADKPSSSPWSR